MRRKFFTLFFLVFPLFLNAQFVENYRENKYPRFISVMAMFNQEAPYLKEWIEYHKLIGVEHFYLYNNNSTDNYLEVLQPYVDAEEVELIDWPSPREGSWVGRQYGAIEHALNKAKNETRWLAILDIDEFIIPWENSFSLYDFLNHHEDYGQIVMMWRYFGTSNVEKIPEGQLLTETLRYREAFVPGKVNKSKSIVKPQVVARGDVHICDLIPNYRTAYYNDGLEEYPPIYVNHYWTRDIDFLMNVKHERQKRLLRRSWTEEEKEHYKNVYNEVYDESLDWILPLLRDEVFN